MSEELVNEYQDGIAFAPSATESPSLFQSEGTSAPPAYEIKFLLSEELARAVEARLRGRLALDPHADPALGGVYRTTSVYTETPTFDVFRRMGEYGKSKFRVRRYGSAGPVFLERKDKDGDRVRKARVAVPAAGLADPTAALGNSHQPGGWFRDEIIRRRLAPLCRISYERVAYMGLSDTGTVRVTFDRKVHGETTTGWEVVPVRSTTELLPGQVICEFKYRAALPHLLREIMTALALHPTTCSKYRRFVAAAGLARLDEAPAGDPAHA